MLPEALSIFIPTYNRSNKLRNLLISLNVIVVENVQVHIIDNASTDGTKEVVNSLQDILQYEVHYYRNSVNIGLSGNILRCFEYCNTEWLWILSDDDPPCENAVDIIYRDINKYNDYIFFNYASSMVERGVSFAMTERKKPFHTVGLKSFIDELDSFVNGVFISSGVYNVNKVLPNLRIGYIYSYSLVPHFAIVLCSLGDNGKVFFSTDKIVFFEPPAARDTWSRLTFMQGINLLMELPIEMDDATFRKLFQKINKWSLTDYQIFEEVSRVYGCSILKKRYVFIQIIARALFKERKFKDKLRLSRYLLKVYFPRWFPVQKIVSNEKSKELLERI